MGINNDVKLKIGLLNVVTGSGSDVFAIEMSYRNSYISNVSPTMTLLN